MSLPDKYLTSAETHVVGVNAKYQLLLSDFSQMERQVLIALAVSFFMKTLSTVLAFDAKAL
jgi:hypothetical protein